MEKEKTTEEKIIAAAKKVFTEKGLTGARMQDIADEAGENKALLHYYFRSKQKLFEIVFEDQLGLMFAAFQQLMMTPGPIEARLEAFIEEEHRIMKPFPSLPIFVLNELTRDPGMLDRLFAKRPVPQLLPMLLAGFQEHMERGEIKQMDARQMLLNVISLMMYPLVAKPIVMKLFNLDEAQYSDFLEERKDSVIQFMKDALRP